MTTITFHDRTLCADSRITQGGIIVDKRNKIFKLQDGRLFAAAGDWGQIYAVYKWLDGGEKPESVEDLEAIIVDPDGTAWSIDESLLISPVNSPCAFGSGREIALTAMMLGKTAREAVEVAIGLDCYSGGPVNEERIKDEAI